VQTAMPEAAGVEQHLIRIFEEMDGFGPQHVVVDAISACQRMAPSGRRSISRSGC